MIGLVSYFSNDNNLLLMVDDVEALSLGDSWLFVRVDNGETDNHSNFKVEDKNWEISFTYSTGPKWDFSSGHGILVEPYQEHEVTDHFSAECCWTTDDNVNCNFAWDPKICETLDNYKHPTHN